MYEFLCRNESSFWRERFVNRVEFDLWELLEFDLWVWAKFHPDPEANANGFPENKLQNLKIANGT